jgi:hypothetical protein
MRSRNDNDFTRRYPAITAGLAGLPDETVVDGELVAFDESGRRSFNALRFSCCANFWLRRLAWTPPFLRRVLFLPRFDHPLGRASASFGACSQTDALQRQDSLS